LAEGVLKKENFGERSDAVGFNGVAFATHYEGFQQYLKIQRLRRYRYVT
jgi:hypothetical protein